MRIILIGFWIEHCNMFASGKEYKKLDEFFKWRNQLTIKADYDSIYMMMLKDILKKDIMNKKRMGYRYMHQQLFVHYFQYLPSISK